ncbi:MAG: glycerol kinase, partial [Gammaproteobacteria bacterium]
MASHRIESIVALDQGTHASRAVLWDRRGQMIYAAHHPVKLQRLGDGRVEQDAEELLASLRDVLAEVRAWAAKHDTHIQAAGLATQRSTVVAWERANGNPLAPALSWQDTRGTDVTAVLLDREEEIRTRSGLRLSPHYGATKIAWLLNHESKVQDAYKAGSLVVG